MSNAPPRMYAYNKYKNNKLDRDKFFLIFNYHATAFG